MERAFLSLLFVLTVLSLSFWPASSRFSDIRLNLDVDNEPFLHGVGSGDPLTNSVLIWTRINTSFAQAAVDWAVWKPASGSFETPEKSGTILANASADHTVTVDVTDLEPNTRYHYQFRDSSNRSSVLGSTFTLPDTTYSGSFDVLATSCTSLYSGYMHSYKSIAEQDANLVLHLGDYIYPDVDPQECNRVPQQLCDYEWWEPCDTSGANSNPLIDDFAAEFNCTASEVEKYRWVHRMYLMDPDFRAARAAHPFVVLYDNHDTSDEEAFFEDGLQAFLEYTPMRAEIEIDNTVNSSRHFRIGNNLVDLITVDTRTYQETNSLIGFEQENWLDGIFQNSSDSETRWRLIANPKMVVPYGLNKLPLGISLIFMVVVTLLAFLLLCCCVSPKVLNFLKDSDNKHVKFLLQLSKKEEETTVNPMAGEKKEDGIDNPDAEQSEMPKVEKCCSICARIGICVLAVTILVWIASFIALKAMLGGDDVIYLDSSDHVWGGNYDSLQRIFASMDSNNVRDNNIWVAGDMHFTVFSDIIGWDDSKAETLFSYRPDKDEDFTRYGVEIVTPSGSRGNVDEKVEELLGFKAQKSALNSLFSNSIDFVTRKGNPHMRLFDGSQHGYTLITFSPTKVTTKLYYADIRDINAKTKLFDTLTVEHGKSKWS